MTAMAVIAHYDTTELGRQQLTTALQSTDHHWEFIEGSLSLKNVNHDAEVISVFLNSKVTAEIMDAMPRLTLICCRSIEVSNVDLAAAAQRNITIVNVPTYGGPSVAEYTFALLLALQRRLPSVFEALYKPYVRSDLMGHDLRGQTLGVIGTGNIGREVARIAQGFSMNVLAFDTNPQPEIAHEYGFTYVDLDRLLRESDIVSLHIPCNTKTHHFLDRDRLLSMKSGAILLNTARGGLVHTPALVEALEAGHLAGAALDAVEGDELLAPTEEVSLLRGLPPERDHRYSVELAVLQRMSNVILSPQNAFHTVEALERINQTTVQNIVDFYNGHQPNAVQYTPPEPGKLILIRHAESEWNAIGVWSGITDICLSEKGQGDCVSVGEKLRNLGIKIDVAFYTEQRRTQQTLEKILPHIETPEIPKICVPGFNERNYGQYTGMDKWKVKEEIGEEEFNRIRRGWDIAFPNGETLKQVYERVVPTYESTVLPRLKAGENVLVVAHGNSLRALMKYLDDLTVDEVENLEMIMGQIVVYDIDPETGRGMNKQSVESGITIESKF